MHPRDLTDEEQSEPGRFVWMAQPHAWLVTADNLHQQAMLIAGQRGRGTLTRIDRDGTKSRWDAADRSVFLLGGFALENILKAYLVYENPAWISNGTLARPLRSHELVRLSSMSKLLPPDDRGTWVLEQFEQGIETWARYPCGLTAVETADQGALSNDLWDGYRRLMKTYARALTVMLGQGWRGPHGFYGVSKIEDGFLSCLEA